MASGNHLAVVSVWVGLIGLSSTGLQGTTVVTCPMTGPPGQEMARVGPPFSDSSCTFRAARYHEACRGPAWPDFQRTLLKVGITIATSTSSLPYSHLNLRRNPFGEFSVEERVALADVDVGQFDALLTDPTTALQFVGEKGYGKTTHLLAIRGRFAEAGYVHIAEGQRASIPVGCPLLIDEAQRLTWWQQWCVFRGRMPLVLGTHRDFTSLLLRAGRSVRTIAVRDCMDPPRLSRLLNARIGWVRRADGPLPRVRVETAAQLLQQFGPDIRSIEHELYAVFQNMNQGIQDV